MVFAYSGVNMQDTHRKQDQALRALCIEIARGDIGGDRFTQLLLEAGVYLDDVEWEFANRLLGRSDQLRTLALDFSLSAQ